MRIVVAPPVGPLIHAIVVCPAVPDQVYHLQDMHDAWVAGLLSKHIGKGMEPEWLEICHVEGAQNALATMWASKCRPQGNNNGIHWSYLDSTCNASKCCWQCKKALHTQKQSGARCKRLKL